ncbi:MAG: Gfo/Idh/MocA family protein [Candidatus Baldrarchaeia archaeon]
MKKVNLGLIGLGFIGKVHLRNCLSLKSARVVAVADVSKSALKYAKDFGVRRLFTDYRELLRQPDIDAVVVSLPTHLHADCAISAMEEGKHVFLEKPLARNLKEGREIVSSAMKNDAKFMIGYPFRFTQEFVILKNQLESGMLGDIQVAHAVDIATGPFLHRTDSTMPSPVPEWWLNKELTGGGALMDLGCHMINLLRWYLGEVSDIRARLGYRFNFDFEDYATCIADFECGASAVINVGWFSQNIALGVELFGTVSHARTYFSPSSRLATAIKLILGKTPKFFIPYSKELSHFIDCINNNDKENQLSGEDALRDLEIIVKAYRNQIN